MDNRGLIERLRRDLTASMFANATDMREDIEAQRRLASDALERAEAELAKYRSAPVVATKTDLENCRKESPNNADVLWHAIVPAGAKLIIRPEAP